MSTLNQIAVKVRKQLREADLLRYDRSANYVHVDCKVDAIIQSACEEATEEIRKDRDLWKAQAEFESEHREKYRQRLISRAATSGARSRHRNEILTTPGLKR